MKQPRIDAFVSKPVKPLASPLDGLPAIEPRNNQAQNKTSPIERPSVPPSGAPSVRTPVRVVRTITRYPFELFQDQIETLKKLSLEEKMRGEKGSMSQMVREAIDAYLAKRNRTE